MILITGPNSNSGSLILENLREMDADVRCMSRRLDDLESLRSQGVEAVYGDYDDPASLASALESVEKAYIVCTPSSKLEARETRFLDACKRAGVRHIVCMGGFPVPGAASPVLAAHRAIEQHADEIGIDWTFVRPLGFMQTVYWMSLPTIQQGGFFVGSVGDGRNAQVDLRNVVEVIVKALTEPGHVGKKYDITGPEALTMAEVALVLSSASRQKLEYRDLPPHAFADGMRKMAVPEFSLEHAMSVFTEIREGRLAVVTNTLTDLGIRPTTWREFADDIVSGKTRPATSH